jgi:hypothetical protein
VTWIRQLDELLRGERTRDSALVGGRFDIPLGTFVPVAVLLGAIYGFFMGWFAVSSWHAGAARQLIASTLKLPALFVLTLLVTFPSLYVFNALVGTRLRFMDALRLLFATIVVNLAVGASLGPILAFFTLSTTSYSFMVVLNVVLLGISGLVALGFLLRTLHRLSVSAHAVPISSEGSTEPGLGPPDSAAHSVFYIWVVIYGLVGAQMGWLLRPFIGHPELPFEWFRVREGNFFIGVYNHLRQLLEQQ